MSAEYARSIQLPTGSLEAALVRPGDVVMVRPAGSETRVPMTVLAVELDFMDVLLHFEDVTRRVSRRMTVGLA